MVSLLAFQESQMGLPGFVGNECITELVSGCLMHLKDGKGQICPTQYGLLKLLGQLPDFCMFVN